jgi:hypothetical protein
MRLTGVLLASDLNPDYLEFWPSTRRAWSQIVGIEPILVLVATAASVPSELRNDPAVIPFEPLEGVHTAFQAQCIRLLYPALVETEGAVIVSDMDLYPLKPSYFHDPVAHLDERFFVTYRDHRLERGEIDMMFNAATPRTWAEVFGIESVADVREQLAVWASQTSYDGRRGREGWYTDQQTLYRRLMSWPARAERHWMLDDDYCGYHQLNRDKLVLEEGLQPQRREAIRRMRYSVFHCLVPHRNYREVNEQVLALGIAAAGAADRGRA